MLPQVKRAAGAAAVRKRLSAKVFMIPFRLRLSSALQQILPSTLHTALRSRASGDTFKVGFYPPGAARAK